MSTEKHYVKNKELLIEVKQYLDTCEYDINGKYIDASGNCTEELGKMILLIANGMASKGNFCGYTYKEDMIGEAAVTVLKYLKNFNPDKSDNAFAYISQIIYNSFVSYITKQKKHSSIKQELYDNQTSTTTEDLNTNNAINYKDLKINI